MVKAIQKYKHPKTDEVWLPGIPIPGLTEKEIKKGIQDGYLVATRAKEKKVNKNGNR
jgi:hypothetical protein